MEASSKASRSCLQRCSEPAAADAAARTARRALAAQAPLSVPELRCALGTLRALRAPAPAADVGRGVAALKGLRAGSGKLRAADGLPGSVAATGLALQVLLHAQIARALSGPGTPQVL